VIFGAGSLVDYPDLVFHADVMITTSIVEGFGMGFLEPWLSGKTLFGRDIPEITSDFKKLGIEFPRMYSSLPIPLNYIEDPHGLIGEYHSYITGTFEKLRLEVPDNLNRKIKHSKIKDNAVDFADLDNARQRKIIELATKVAYSQKETTATLVDADIPYFAPKFPANIPAIKQAITPDT